MSRERSEEILFGCKRSEGNNKVFILIMTTIILATVLKVVIKPKGYKVHFF